MRRILICQSDCLHFRGHCSIRDTTIDSLALDNLEIARADSNWCHAYTLQSHSP